MEHCPICNGPTYTLGTLGTMHWRRCEDCGHETGNVVDYYHEEEEDTNDE